jgi:hypothetical protein
MGTTRQLGFTESLKRESSGHFTIDVHLLIGAPTHFRDPPPITEMN